METDCFDKVPEGFRTVVLDFVLNCLLDKPQDYIERGCEYFGALLGSMSKSKRVEVEFAEPDIKILARRNSVVSESWNPIEEELPGTDASEPKTDEERAKISNYLSELLILRTLDQNVKDKVIDIIKTKSVKSGEVVVKQGDEYAECLYLIREGVFQFTLNTDAGEEVVETLDGSGTFCELALFYSTSVMYTVRAVTDGILWVLKRPDFRKIVSKCAHNKTSNYRQMMDVMPFLGRLDSIDKLNLADALSTKFYDNGDVIFTEGDPADGIYFIESGRVVLTVDRPEHKKCVVAELKVGKCLGELSLTKDKPRRLVSAFASGKTRLAFLSCTTIQRLLGSCVDQISDYFDEQFKIPNSFGFHFMQHKN